TSDAARQTLLPREVRLSEGATRHERGDHGRARPRPDRGLPDRTGGGDDAARESVGVAARRTGLAGAPRPARGTVVSLGGGAPAPASRGEARRAGGPPGAAHGYGERRVLRRRHR